MPPRDPGVPARIKADLRKYLLGVLSAAPVDALGSTTATSALAPNADTFNLERRAVLAAYIDLVRAYEWQDKVTSQRRDGNSLADFLAVKSRGAKLRKQLEPRFAPAQLTQEEKREEFALWILDSADMLGKIYSHTDERQHKAIYHFANSRTKQLTNKLKDAALEKPALGPIASELRWARQLNSMYRGGDHLGVVLSVVLPGQRAKSSYPREDRVKDSVFLYAVTHAIAIKFDVVGVPDSSFQTLLVIERILADDVETAPAASLAKEVEDTATTFAAVSRRTAQRYNL